MKLLALFLLLIAQSYAGLSVAVGQFTKAAGTPTFTQTVTDTNFGGGTPVAVILWTTGQSATGFTTHGNFAIGAAVAGIARTAGITDQDASASNTSNRYNYSANAIAWQTNGATTLIEVANLSSFGANSFTLSWTTGAGAGTLYNYLLLGGTDITNANLIEGTIPATTPASVGYTGMGFKPDFIFLFGCGNANVLGTGNNAPISFGMGTSSSARGTSGSFQTHFASPAAGASSQSSSFVYRALNTTSTNSSVGDLVSMDTDGFTINWTTVVSTSRLFAALGLKGGRYKVGNYNKSTGGAPASQGVTGVGFSPSVVVQFSIHNVTTAGFTALQNVSFGATTSLSHVNGWAWQKSGTLPAVADRYIDATNMLMLGTGPSTADATAAFTSLDADGWTESWNPNSAVADQIMYFAIGPAAGASGHCPSCDLSQLRMPYD